MDAELQATLTLLLKDIRAEESDGWEQVLPLIYDRLRNLAAQIAGPDADAATLSPTALVHEAWAKLSDGKELVFRDRDHFFAIAALTMRRVLVDQARRNRAQKRGRARDRITLSGLPEASRSLDLADLDEALRELELLSARQARVVELRFFGGLTIAEIARCLDRSVATIETDWRTARAWLGAVLEPPTG